MPRDIDPQAVDMRGSYPPPTSGTPADIPCIGADSVIGMGAGSADEGNAQMGTQMGGEQPPTGPRLGGW